MMNSQIASNDRKSKSTWHVVVTVNPVTTLIVEAWLKSHNIDKKRVICLSERGFQVEHCRVVITKGFESLIGCGKATWVIGVGKEAARVGREVAVLTQGRNFILLKSNLRDPIEHVLHLFKNCAGVYYMEEGAASHFSWQQQRSYWSSIKVWITWFAVLYMLGKHLTGLRMSELFQTEGSRILGHLALSPSAFPNRKPVEMVTPHKISETTFDAVFLGDPGVETGSVNQSERQRWLKAVAADLRSRGVRKLGVRVHPSERIHSYGDYKKFFESACNESLLVEAYPLPVDVIHPSPQTPLYQITSSAAIYGKENGFLVVSMKLRTGNLKRHKLRHLKQANRLLDRYVDAWL